MLTKIEVSEGQTPAVLAQWLQGVEPASTSTLPVKKQAEMYLLLWELDGRIKALKSGCVSGAQLRECKLARRAVGDCFGVLSLSDEAMEMANRMMAERALLKE